MPLDLQSKRLVDCMVCGRRFDESRILDHQDVCKRAAKGRRKPFDSFKQRVRGTVMETHVDKIKTRLHGQMSARLGRSPINGRNQTKHGKAPSMFQNASKMQHGDWRKAHEDFIAAIKAAKNSRPTKGNVGKADKCSPTLPTVTPMRAS